MKILTFAIHDSKAHAYLQPFFMHNKELAIRSFSEAVNNPDTQFHKHPLDYTLFHIGNYDDELGLLMAQLPPEMLTTADQQIKLEHNDIPIQQTEKNNEIK